ncbi:MAG TPA: PH domain-containing protein [Marmoricola sp.]|nr:PH domain-containing protein [Marmoricola sp.]
MTEPTPAATLREPRRRVSRRAPLMWTVSALLQGCLGAATLVVVVDAWQLFGMPWWGWLCYAAVALAYAGVMPAFRYRVHRWESTADAVYTQTGWLTRERRIAPMSRVQTVDLEQGPVSRLLGLAEVTVTTASAAGPVKIEALEYPVAVQLVDELTRRTSAVAGDAT